MRRSLAFLFGVAPVALLAGCIDDLDPVTRIDRTRVIAAIAEVEGRPEAVHPAPGERVSTRTVVQGFDPQAGITWLIYGCRAAPIRGGAAQCTFGVFDGDTLVIAPIFDPEVDDGDTVNGLDPDAFLVEAGQLDPGEAAPALTVRLLPEVLPTAQERCPDEDARVEEDGQVAGFDAAAVLFTGVVCGPGARPVPPPFVTAFDGVVRGELPPEALFSDEPTFAVASCVDADTGTRTERSAREEEAFSFTLTVELPPPAPSAQGNRRPRLVDPIAPDVPAFLFGQGTDCFPGFDHENADTLAERLRPWPATDATRCDDPTFPETAKVRAADGDVCLATRVVVPEWDPAAAAWVRTDAMEIFDEDGDAICAANETSGGPGDRPPRWETLSLANFTTAGELDRLFSNFEAVPPGPNPSEPPSVRNPAFVEWSLPDAAPPPEGQVVDFFFVLRDRREGMDVATRRLCLLP